ncbi:hypothetical protein E2562_021067 [Oryza meyeriana var. granulata]|uniref:Uncharacterized protein n=1 Tax=Oryza meyeriana var. granulata TaxID=110450 RepID=A0A6G1BM16_9ORYZ|nr:hypothetical protein E2562_021067 [Oryza meyeriana var. granulata]
MDPTAISSFLTSGRGVTPSPLAGAEEAESEQPKPRRHQIWRLFHAAGRDVESLGEPRFGEGGGRTASATGGRSREEATALTTRMLSRDPVFSLAAAAPSRHT